MVFIPWEFDSPLGHHSTKGFILSNEFYQFNFPCKSCVISAVCKEKPDNAKEIILEYPDPVVCLTFPKTDLSKKTYHKMLVECWANLGPKILNNVTKQSSVDYKKEINNNIPRDYLYLMGYMAGILAHMVNTTSWDIGETEPFDHDEINRRLKNLKLSI